MSLNSDKLLSQLRQVDGYNFEHLVADVWEQRGWQTEVTDASNDHGIDVIAKKSSPYSQKQLIQAKRYSANNTVGSPAIQQYSSLRHQQDDVDAVIVVTTSSFTPDGRELAEDLNVKLVNGNKLSDMILELNSQRFLSKYFEKNVDMDVKSTNTSMGSRDKSSQRKRSSSKPFDKLSNANPTKDHEYFASCPICRSPNSIWYVNERGVKKLQCEECNTAWMKKGINESKWEVYRGRKDGTAKTMNQWKEKSTR